MAAPSAKALGKPLSPCENFLMVKHPEAPKQKDSPAQICTVSFAQRYWQAWCGQGGSGGHTGRVALGGCQEGFSSTELPVFPASTLSCSFLQLLSVRLSLSLADSFIWVLTLLQAKAQFLLCLCQGTQPWQLSAHGRSGILSQVSLRD